MGQLGKGYLVEVKKKGQWQTINPNNALNYIAALSKGAREVEGSAAASFRIKPTSSRPQSRARDTFFLRNLQKYRQGKQAKGVYVERDMFRINSPGELRQITARGLASSKAQETAFDRYMKAIGGR